jgi:hypothetical protein
MTHLTPWLALYNIGYLAVTWLFAIGGIAFFWHYRTWWGFVVAFLVVSSRQQALLNCEHEAQHRKFLPNCGGTTWSEPTFVPPPSAPRMKPPERGTSTTTG